MSAKTFYDVLGVARNATTDEIRQAYLQRSKSTHPDRFDQAKQPAEWNLANEKLKELNAAYALLRDSARRAEYDAQVYGSPSGARPGQSSRAQASNGGVKLGRLKAGMAYFSTLPKEVQERLLKRCAGENIVQWYTKLQSLPGLYVGSVILAAWLFFVFASANANTRWSNDTSTWMFVLTAAAGVAQCFVILRIIKWHKSSLRPMFFITPLYFIKTSLDKVWFWPIWELKSIGATHKHVNGVYRETTVDMVFKEQGSESISITPKFEYDNLLRVLSGFTSRFNIAREQQDSGYFYDQDDFREYDPDKAPAPARPNYLRNGAIAGAILLLYLICFGIAVSINGGKPQRYATSSRSSSYENNSYSNQKSAPHIYPEVPLPYSGQIFEYPNADPARGARVAPFKVTAPLGSHCYVKLVDATTGRPVLAVFVRSGSTTEVSVPLGSFEVRYASGDRWCGAEHLFGSETSYSRAREIFNFHREQNGVSGYSVTLYPVRGGNLSTERISEDGF